jgi:integrase
MRRQKQRSLVTQRRDGSATWYENFTVRGHRFRAGLETDDRQTAEILAAKIYSDALLGKLTPQKPELTLTQALARYWLQHGQHLRSKDDIRRIGLVLQDPKQGLGKDLLLSALTAADLSSYAARRRAKLSNRSVNIELEHLRAVMRRARDLWGVAVANIDWKKILLEEAGEREHVLSLDDEEKRLFAALRADYHPMFRFALVTGVRLANVVGLTWRQVDWQAGTIVFRVKSKKPEGELHYVPITPAVATILSQERGRHLTRVFTYVCARNRRDPKRGTLQKKGERDPFTQDGWRKEWKRALATAGIEDFRFHDLRHTAGTRALRAHRNLRAVQKMLGHQSITTTLRYTRSDIDDVRAAMEAVEKATLRPRVVAEQEKKEAGSVG